MEGERERGRGRGSGEERGKGVEGNKVEGRSREQKVLFSCRMTPNWVARTRVHHNATRKIIPSVRAAE